ncbi:MAG: hypothetical protein KBG30_08980 [Bacteroidales bacterium]|nr:hypothetical protein [Bacteroidales bacterium]
MKLENVLKELEVNYGWSFYDEKGKLHLEDMQKELLQDTIKAVKNLCISDVRLSLPSEEDIREPIQNALYATRHFLTDQCTELADGILDYLNDAGFKVVRQ